MDLGILVIRCGIVLKNGQELKIEGGYDLKAPQEFVKIASAKLRQMAADDPSVKDPNSYNNWFHSDKELYQQMLVPALRDLEQSHDIEDSFFNQ